MGDGSNFIFLTVDFSDLCKDVWMLFGLNRGNTRGRLCKITNIQFVTRNAGFLLELCCNTRLEPILLWLELGYYLGCLRFIWI